MGGEPGAGFLSAPAAAGIERSTFMPAGRKWVAKASQGLFPPPFSITVHSEDERMAKKRHALFKTKPGRGIFTTSNTRQGRIGHKSERPGQGSKRNAADPFFDPESGMQAALAVFQDLGRVVVAAFIGEIGRAHV